MMTSMQIEVDGLVLRPVPGSGDFDARQSSIKNYLDCHRLFGWERIEDLTPEAVRWPLLFGTATHKFLQAVNSGKTTQEAVEIGLYEMDKELPPLPTFGLEDERSQHRELAKHLWPMHVAYWQQTDEQFIPLGNEVKGRVEVGDGTGVFLVFQTDKLGMFLNAFWILDYKTMAKNDDRNFQTYEMDMQPTAYVYGASKVLQQRVAGVIIDGLIKTKVPQFRREQYIRSDQDLLEFEREFPEICHEIAWRANRVSQGGDWKTIFYKNTRHCFHWGRACDFFQLCRRDTPINRMQYRHRDRDYMDDPRLLSVAGANQGVKK